jgi:DNA-binding NtrC family response regulator
MAKPAANVTILYGELDAEVLASQAAVIQKAGHQVVAAVGRAEVERTLRQGTFDMVILGQTLTKNDRHHLPYMVKKAHPAARVLVLHAGGHHPEVDVAIEAGTDLKNVLDAIASMSAPASPLTKEAIAGR